MDQDQAFRQAVIDNPEDDSVRLIFADWLDENGQGSRAEFIRVQIELARLPEADRASSPLKRREVWLQQEFARHWRNEVPQFPGVIWPASRWGGLFYQRGFVEALFFTRWQPLHDYAEAALASAPVISLGIESVDFPSGTTGEFAGSSLLSQVRSLSVGTGFEIDGLISLSHSPYVRNLGRLVCRAGPFGSRTGTNGRGDEAAKAIAASSTLTGLRSLTLFGDTGPAGAIALAGARCLANLRSLDLGWSSIGDEGVLALLESPILSRLERFMVNYRDLSGAVANRFAQRFRSGHR